MNEIFFYASANGVLFNFDGIEKFDTEAEAIEHAGKCKALDIRDYDEVNEYLVFRQFREFA